MDSIFLVLKSPILLGVVSFFFFQSAFRYAFLSFKRTRKSYHILAIIYSLLNSLLTAFFSYNFAESTPNWIPIILISGALLIDVFTISIDSPGIYVYLVAGVIFVISINNLLVLVIAGLITNTFIINNLQDAGGSTLIITITLALSGLYLYALTHSRYIKMKNWKAMIHSKKHGSILFFYFVVFDVAVCICSTLVDGIVSLNDHLDPVFVSYMQTMFIVVITLFVSSLLIVIISSRSARAHFNESALDKKMHSEYQKAIKDPLTGILNRRGLEEKIRNALENDVAGAMFLLDMDNFKDINDHFGHPEGDDLLKMVAKALLDEFRQGDYVGRLGGDEFLVYAPSLTERKHIIVKANQLIRKLSFRYEKKNPTFRVTATASVGISRFPEDGLDYDEIYQKVDEALYKSKNMGKGRFTFAE